MTGATAWLVPAGRPFGPAQASLAFMAHLRSVPDREPKPAALIQSVDRAISVLELPGRLMGTI